MLIQEPKAVFFSSVLSNTKRNKRTIPETPKNTPSELSMLRNLGWFNV